MLEDRKIEGLDWMIERLIGGNKDWTFELKDWEHERLKHGKIQRMADGKFQNWQLNSWHWQIDRSSDWEIELNDWNQETVWTASTLQSWKVEKIGKMERLGVCELKGCSI